MERSRIFYSINFFGKVHNSFQVLNGANHTLEAFITLQSSAGQQATSKTKFRLYSDILLEEINLIFFRKIRAPSKYLMAPFNSRFQPYKVTFFFKGS